LVKTVLPGYGPIVMKTVRTIAAAVILCLFYGCAVSLENAGDAGSASLSGKARVLVYLYVKDGKRPPLLSFTLGVSALKKSGGQQVALDGEAKTVNASELLGSQLILGEYFVEPGSFDAVEIRITAASLAGADVFSKLTGSKTYVLPVNFSLLAENSFVVNIEWDAVASVISPGVVEPAMYASGQQALAHHLVSFISNEGSDYVSVIDIDKERVIGAISVGRAPTSIVSLSGANDAYVLNSGDGTVSVVDLLSFKVRETISPVGGVGSKEMVGVKTGSGFDGVKLYIMNAVSNDVTVVNANTRLTTKTIVAGLAPKAIAAHKTRKEVYVANFASGDISVIAATSDNVVAQIKVGVRPTGLAVSGDKLYVFDDTSLVISVVSLSDRKESFKIPIAHSVARGITAFDGRLFAMDTVNDKVVFFSQTDVVVGAVVVCKGSFAAVADEFRNRLYVACRDDGSVGIVDVSAQKALKKLKVGSRPYGVMRFE